MTPPPKKSTRTHDPFLTTQKFDSLSFKYTKNTNLENIKVGQISFLNLATFKSAQVPWTYFLTIIYTGLIRSAFKKHMCFFVFFFSSSMLFFLQKYSESAFLCFFFWAKMCFFLLSLLFFQKNMTIMKVLNTKK